MKQVLRINQRDINSGKPWSQMDIDDLKASIACGKDDLAQTALVLCRAVIETRAKAKAPLRWPCCCFCGLRSKKKGPRRRETPHRGLSGCGVPPFQRENPSGTIRSLAD